MSIDKANKNALCRAWQHRAFQSSSLNTGRHPIPKSSTTCPLPLLRRFHDVLGDLGKLTTRIFFAPSLAGYLCRIVDKQVGGGVTRRQSQNGGFRFTKL